MQGVYFVAYALGGSTNHELARCIPVPEPSAIAGLMVFVGAGFLLKRNQFYASLILKPDTSSTKLSELNLLNDSTLFECAKQVVCSQATLAEQQ